MAWLRGVGKQPRVRWMRRNVGHLGALARREPCSRVFVKTEKGAHGLLLPLNAAPIHYTFRAFGVGRSVPGNERSAHAASRMMKPMRRSITAT